MKIFHYFQRWNDELAASALRYAQECVFEHSTNRYHSRYDWVGENIYIKTGRRKDKVLETDETTKLEAK